MGLLGVAPPLGDRTVQSILSKIGIFGFCVTIISGTVLLAPAIREYLSNGYFAIKMIVILLAGISQRGFLWKVHTSLHSLHRVG